MYYLIADKIDGEQIVFYSAPNGKVFRYKYKGKMSIYSYDDIEEFCIFLDKIHSTENEVATFKIENNRLINIEIVDAKKLKVYKYNYIVCDGHLMLVDDYLERT